MSSLKNNISKMLEVRHHGWSNVYLSTSESCMVGLALCDPLVFESTGYSVEEAWQTVDREQIKVICAWAVPRKWLTILND